MVGSSRTSRRGLPEGRCDADPLLLAPGEFVRPASRDRRGRWQPHRAEQLDGPGPGLGPG
ncbi:MULTISPECIES: hypothetical protein [Frankia]|uniref:hypothetical protein n=1 Tax=Frankia sp. CeD TaxID=258230 RepID=UPI001F28CB54|nr:MULTISPECIES: hypothetical protein [Frankia]